MISKDMFAYLIPVAKSHGRSISTYIHIAVLMKGKKVVEMAKNKAGSRKQGCGYTNRTIHAEIAVIKKMGDMKALKGLTLVVLRYGPGIKGWVYSKPCPHCSMILEKIMREYGLQKVYYSS